MIEKSTYKSHFSHPSDKAEKFTRYRESVLSRPQPLPCSSITKKFNDRIKVA
jgi:hypothetical protein